MIKTTRPLRGRKLLVAGLGVGSLTFAFCGMFPGCNLLAPPPCSEDPDQYQCQDLQAPSRDGAANSCGDAGAVPDAGGDGGAVCRDGGS
jgi:hypothetical protein